LDIQGLKAALLQGIFGPGEVPSYVLSAEEWAAIHQLSAERYQQWDWNYGHSPRFNIEKSDQTPAGKIDIRIDVDKGRIRSIKFFGDFSGRLPVAGLEELFQGVRYNRDELNETLKIADVGQYFDQLDRSTLSNLLY
jgi:lipoate-protein ligase A